jgi:predicted nucleic acid-binding protein
LAEQIERREGLLQPTPKLLPGKACTTDLTDVEVLQELLHRYLAMDRRDAIGPAWEAIVGVVDVIHAIEREDVERARRLIDVATSLSARDAVHVAVMQRHGITRILSFDAGFDGILGIERIAG